MNVQKRLNSALILRCYGCPRGGMVDAADLKSVDFGRAGSSPAEGTKLQFVRTAKLT